MARRLGTSGFLLSAGLLAVLVACSDEQPAAPPATPDTRTEQPAEEGGSRLDDAARNLRDEAQRLGEEARKAAERALEDAGPLLDEAGKAAARLGRAMSEVLDKAAQDLNRAVDALENRDAATDRPQTGDAAAMLSPGDRLNADTRAAARAFPAGVGPAYVGVWAGEPAACARIDQDPVELFAVVTPSTIRRMESVCNFAAADVENGSANVTASCIAEGDSEERAMTFRMDGNDRMAITQDGTEGPLLHRCYLPDEQ